MRTTAIVAVGIALIGSALYAADAPAPAMTSALISDLVVQPNDSPLVRAAKRAVATRAGLAVHARVIDNATLRSIGGHISVSTSQGAAIPSGGSAGQQYPADSNVPANAAQTRAQLQQRLNNLRQEQGVMAEEADQPYSGFYNEDLVNKRMSEIPGQMNQLQNQLNRLPPPPAASSPTPTQYSPPQ